MTFKFILSGLLLSLGSIAANAQKAYWQQKVDNDITVTLDDKAHMLRGYINITYTNNSPDTLRFIYFHLYPNAYSSDRTAYEKQTVENGSTDHYFSDEEDRGFIDSIKFSVSGSSGGEMKAAGIIATKDPDIVRLILPEPLLPGGGLRIETPFRVKIPLTFSRLGHTDQAYHISQWFPKPAVYDSKGWHPIPYLDQGEFYSEYGSYRVAVTLPRNYILMGTGNMAEQDEIQWLDALSKKELPSDTLYRRVMPPSAEELKTVTFTEDNIHDFAWFADKRWIVRKDTVAVPETGKIITAYSCYLPVHLKGWANSLESVKTGIREYSNRVGAYPYNTVKAVEGSLNAGGGMEYPTITVIAVTNNEQEVHTAIVHEVGHNWFYGILGNNERSYPWMDEGINSFYEHKIAPGKSSFKSLDDIDDFRLVYSGLSAERNLFPADTAADVMPQLSYGVDIYGKSAYLLAWLEGYMGADSFNAAMKDYYRTWQFRHPQPEDFEAAMRRHTALDLDWFFNDAMKTSQPIDYKIVSVKQLNATTAAVTLKNRTGVKGPAAFTLYGKDKEGNRISLSSWTDPFTGTVTQQVVTPPFGPKWSDGEIGKVVPDYNTRNNHIRSGFSIRPFLGLNMSRNNKMWVSPALGYNYYDGFMAGLLLHNITFPQNKFQFAFAPMYGFGSKTFAGTGIAGYTFYSKAGWLHDVQFNVEGKTFSYDKSNLNIGNYLYNRFIKVAPELIFNLRKPYPRSTVERSISFKGYWIREEQFAFNMNPSDSLYRPSKGGYQDNFYGRVRYQHNNNRTFNPFGYTLEGQAGKQFAKLSIEANLRVDYFKKNKALYIRGYAGKFFNFADNNFDAYRYRLATTYSGQNDYLYDETYIGRNEQTGFASQQISMKEGGFKVNTLQYAAQIGLSDDWLFSLNLKSDLPFWNLPVRLFADVATFSGAKKANPSGAGIVYEAGLEVYLADYVSVYLPLVMSKDYNEYTKSVYSENRFLKTITFSINLGNRNWMKLPGKILKM